MKKKSFYVLLFWNVVTIILLLSSFSFPYVAGYYSSEAKKEELSHYISSRVKDSTNGGTLMAVTAGKLDDSVMLPSPDDEFLKLYAVFSQARITFSSGFNIHKNHNISIDEIDKSVNYSIIYTGEDSSKEYKGHYKHWTYPFELMFETPRLYNVSKYMIYISQEHADILLSNNGGISDEYGYSEEEYQSLIGQMINITVDGVPNACVICNIFYQQNYYYDSLREVAGDFVLCAYYSPTPFYRENMYFFSDYSYCNSYFIDYLVDMYPRDHFRIDVVSNNFTREIDEDYVTSFYYDRFIDNRPLILLFVLLSIVIISLVCFLVAVSNVIDFKIFQLLGLLSFFTSYTFFNIFHKFSSSLLFFSDFGIRFSVYAYFYFLIASSIIFLIEYLYKQKSSRERLK